MKEGRKEKKVIRALYPVLWSKNKKKRTRLIYSIIIKSVMIYGSDGWQLNESQKKRFLATEMNLWRSAPISPLDRIGNERVSERIKVKKENHLKKFKKNNLVGTVIYWNNKCRMREFRKK